MVMLCFSPCRRDRAWGWGGQARPKVSGVPLEHCVFPRLFISSKTPSCWPQEFCRFLDTPGTRHLHSTSALALGTGVGCSSSQLKVKEIPINPLKAGSAKGNICPCFWVLDAEDPQHIQMTGSLLFVFPFEGWGQEGEERFYVGLSLKTSALWASVGFHYISGESLARSEGLLQSLDVPILWGAPSFIPGEENKVCLSGWAAGSPSEDALLFSPPAQLLAVVPAGPLKLLWHRSSSLFHQPVAAIPSSHLHLFNLV